MAMFQKCLKSSKVSYIAGTQVQPLAFLWIPRMSGIFHEYVVNISNNFLIDGLISINFGLYCSESPHFNAISTIQMLVGV